MALIIDTEEAGHLAQELVRLTGQNVVDAVTEALRLRVERLRHTKALPTGIVGEVQTFARSIAHRYDRRPITRQEWDAAGGDDFAITDVPSAIPRRVE